MIETTEKTMTVTLSIDGHEVTVAKGQTILEAAQQAGITIPTLCHLKELSPDGSCRMCTVEVEGGRKGGLVRADGHSYPKRESAQRSPVYFGLITQQPSVGLLYL